MVVVWGPAGAPGRTTVATHLACEVARRGVDVVLADLDPYGGAVAQQLGILDEVSGLLSASRLAGAGQLDDRFASVCRGIGDHLAVVTGLPRADRWREVRAAQVEQLLERGAAGGQVVVDTGFCLEDDAGSDFGGRPARNALTLAALDQADEIVVVGAADPVGLARLARGLVDLRERATRRAGAGRGQPDARLDRLVGEGDRRDGRGIQPRVAGLHFLPEDRAGLDRALVVGPTARRARGLDAGAGPRRAGRRGVPEHASGPRRAEARGDHAGRSAPDRWSWSNNSCSYDFGQESTYGGSLLEGGTPC